jgi:DNA-binding GntR family transcriptional regulator
MARAAARSHYARHGELPSARELADAAGVSRGTAGAVLKELRDERHRLHLVHGTTDSRTDS